MDLKVNHEELNNFYDLSQNEREFIKEKLSEFLEKIEELHVIWQGTDSDEFYDNVTNYIKRLEIIPNFYDTMNNFVLDANREYRKADSESKKEFEKISDEKGELDVRYNN